jgi:hypothetical protein
MQVMTDPASTGTIRETARRVVLLPAPLAPMMVTISPASILKADPVQGFDITV